MRISEHGIDLIKRFEGFRADAYPDPATGGKPWTIGYGSTMTDAGIIISKGMHVTETEADRLLRATIHRYEDTVNASLAKPVKQHQFDAMVCFTYNVGGHNFQESSILRLFNQGMVKEAGDAFLLWNKAGGHVMEGLTRRRHAERAMFLGQ